MHIPGEAFVCAAQNAVSQISDGGRSGAQISGAQFWAPGAQFLGTRCPKYLEIFLKKKRNFFFLFILLLEN
jgi:hypothetical protein